MRALWKTVLIAAALVAGTSTAQAQVSHPALAAHQHTADLPPPPLPPPPGPPSPPAPPSTEPPLDLRRYPDPPFPYPHAQAVPQYGTIPAQSSTAVAPSPFSAVQPGGLPNRFANQPRAGSFDRNATMPHRSNLRR